MQSGDYDSNSDAKWQAADFCAVVLSVSVHFFITLRVQAGAKK